MSTQAQKFLVMAGGTGGHVYPGLAVATELRARGHEVEWMGTAAGLEARAVPAAGIRLHAITVSGLRGNGLKRWLLAPPRLLAALAQAVTVVRGCRPNAVLGLGGFASGPGGIAAVLCRRPLVIHEQNAVPGLTNRLLSRLARRVLQAFPGSFAASLRAETTGNPVRSEICAVAPVAVPADGVLEVLVIGGSQGAMALNDLLPRALAALPDSVRFRVTHQCGERHLEAATRAYREAGLEVRPVPFIDDMARAYARAHLVVCRAGAMSVCEVAAAGRAALFIPYPYAVDDHQSANARHLTDHGAALALAERGLDAEALASTLAELLSAPQRLVRMGGRARELARVDATARVTDACLEVADV